MGSFLFPKVQTIKKIWVFSYTRFATKLTLKKVANEKMSVKYFSDVSEN